jgi:hypothetical protein
MRISQTSWIEHLLKTGDDRPVMQVIERAHVEVIHLLENRAPCLQSVGSEVSFFGSIIGCGPTRFSNSQ